MIVYTTGFTQKTAEFFFEQLKGKNIDLLIDIRLNNKSQLAGFTKEKDLKYFLKELAKISYAHDTTFAPTEELLKDYQKKRISWEEYKDIFNDLMRKRDIEKHFIEKYSQRKGNICLMCSELSSENCHRKLVADYLTESLGGEIQVVHL